MHSREGCPPTEDRRILFLAQQQLACPLFARQYEMFLQRHVIRCCECRHDNFEFMDELDDSQLLHHRAATGPGSRPAPKRVRR